MNKKHRNSRMSEYWAKEPILVKTPLGRGISVVFSWQVDKAIELAKREGINLIGGPGAILAGLKVPELNYTLVDRHNQFATFTTRGCPNSCPFCAVPILEGEFRELKEWKPNPIICDNNILACSDEHFKKVIDSVIDFGWVDFNQGLDHHLITDYHLEQLQRVKKSIIRFSFDSIKEESSFISGVEKTKEYGFKNIRCYVLIGFNDTPADALYRLELCKKVKVLPQPMRYQPIDTEKKNSYVAEDKGWTEQELKKMTKYWFHLNITEKIPYAEFNSDEKHPGSWNKMGKIKKATIMPEMDNQKRREKQIPPRKKQPLCEIVFGQLRIPVFDMERGKKVIEGIFMIGETLQGKAKTKGRREGRRKAPETFTNA